MRSASPRRRPLRVLPHPRAATPRRRARRRRLRRGADAARRMAAQDPDGADRGRRAPRAREPHRRGVRASDVPRVSDPRPRRQGAGRRAADPVAAHARSRATKRGALLRSPEDGPLVLVFGGSQGARTLNDAALSAWGERGPARAAPLRRARLPGAARARHAARLPAAPFVDDFGAALGAADIVVARAGGSVWEVAAAGKPAVLVPYPHATADHQQRNAEYFVDAGGAVIVDDADAAAASPERGRGAARRPGAAAGDGRGDARRRETRCRRQDRR